MKKINCREIVVRTMIELLARRSYDHISVQDILDETGVSRATFYKHFSCKEQLLAEAFDLLWKEAVIPAQPDCLYAYVQALLHMICENACIMRRAWQISAFRAHLEAFFRDKLTHEALNSCSAHGEFAFLLQFMTAVLMDVVSHYIEMPERKEICSSAENIQRLWSAMNRCIHESSSAA